MKTNKGFIHIALPLVVIAILAFIGYQYFYKNQEKQDSKPAYLAPSEEVQYQWGFVDLGADVDNNPHTKVSLNVDGKVYDAGTYLGGCSEVESGEIGVTGELADMNEKSRVQCWFAGSGDEVGVFQEALEIIVKHGELGEGDNGDAPFRGNFKTLFTISPVLENKDNTQNAATTTAQKPCTPRPACLDAVPRCLMPETPDMCPKALPIQNKDNSIACTQEAKLCPNGSYVGRTGPNCEFAPCR